MQLKCLKGWESRKLVTSEFLPVICGRQLLKSCQKNESFTLVNIPASFALACIFSRFSSCGSSHHRLQRSTVSQLSPLFATSSSNLISCRPFRKFGRRQRQQEGGDKTWLGCRCCRRAGRGGLALCDVTNGRKAHALSEIIKRVKER